MAPPHAPGTPCWIDHASSEPDAAASFYASLLGWETTPRGAPGVTEGYRMFLRDDVQVAGLRALASAGQHAAWTMYVSVASADATAAAVREGGGVVLAEPTDVLDAGRMLTFADPVGAVLAGWEPRRHRGADLAGVEPGTVCWNELACRHPIAPRRFYGATFGWTRAPGAEDEGEHTRWSLGGRDVAGCVTMDERWPAEAPPMWMVYVAVEDCDETARRAEELGGTVLAPPAVGAPGRFPLRCRFSALADPQGAAFSVLAPAPADAV